MKNIGKKAAALMVILLIAGIAAACGPATPPADEGDSSASQDSGSEESASEQSGSDESGSEQRAEESSISEELTEEIEQEAPSLEGSFELYGDADEDDFITSESGLQYFISEVGEGETPETGEVVSVHYTGYLTNGTIFDSSRDRGQPFSFPLGTGSVIAGWDEGIGYLPVGSSGRLIIPADLAYGDSGAGALIQPGETLVFDVELVEILPPPPEAPTAVDEGDYQLTDLGVSYFDLEEGSGAEAEDGKIVTVHYTGWLEDGPMFDSSFLQGQPIAVLLGAGQVIPGWEDGLKGMKTGGSRQIVIPSELAYGEDGAGGGIIPPNATLVFEVELVDVTDPE